MKVGRCMLALSAVAVGLTACARATGDVTGGEETLDPAPPEFVGNCDVTEMIDAGSGSRWTDLYRDLFGPTSAAKCSRFDCHGNTSNEASKYLVCVDQNGCRDSMIQRKLVRPLDDRGAPEKSALYTTLRHCTDDKKTQGIMPRQPAGYHFSKASMARVAEWIRNGSPND